MNIQTFDHLEEAIYALEEEAEWAMIDGTYFKAELYKTEDNRWRLGIITEDQLELKI